MKTFSQFMIEAQGDYDHEFQSGAQISGGHGATIGRDRRGQGGKGKPRTKTIFVDGKAKVVPVTYVGKGEEGRRSDAGKPRPASTRLQQPTGEKRELTPQEKRERARQEYLAKKRAKESGESAPTSKKLSQQATRLLSVKAPEPQSQFTPSPRQGARSPLLHPNEPDRILSRKETERVRNVGRSLLTHMRGWDSEGSSDESDDEAYSKEKHGEKKPVHKDASVYMGRLHAPTRGKGTLHPHGAFGYTKKRIAQDKEKEEKQKELKAKRKEDYVRRAQKYAEIDRSAQHNLRVKRAGEKILSDIQQGKD